MKKLLSILLLSLVTIGGVFAYSGYNADNKELNPNYSEERCEAMQNAFENLDYEAWKEIMEQNPRKGKVLDVITEENFDIFVQAREARLAGDDETAKELMASLGLNQGEGPKNGHGFKNGNRQMQGAGNGKALNN